MEILDFGNIVLSYYDIECIVQQMYQVVLNVLQVGYFFLVVGGDYGVMYLVVKVLYDLCDGFMGFIQLDVYCDLLDFFD